MCSGSVSHPDVGRTALAAGPIVLVVILRLRNYKLLSVQAQESLLTQVHSPIWALPHPMLVIRSHKVPRFKERFNAGMKAESQSDTLM